VAPALIVAHQHRADLEDTLGGAGALAPGKSVQQRDSLLAPADNRGSVGCRVRRWPGAASGGSFFRSLEDFTAKKRGPLQAVPVMARAIADRLE
jgi:hypothetical protein